MYKENFYSVLCTYSIAQVIAVLITALRPMRRRLLQQDRGNTAEADHAQIVNTSHITEEELTHAPGINCKLIRVKFICRTASSVWVLFLFIDVFQCSRPSSIQFCHTLRS